MPEGITAKDLHEGVLIRYDPSNNLDCVFAPTGMTRRDFYAQVGGKLDEMIKDYYAASAAARHGVLAETTIRLKRIRAFSEEHNLRGVDGLVTHIVGEAAGKYLAQGNPYIPALKDFLNAHGI